MIFFWTAWLAVGLALVIAFLCKVPALFVKRIISSAVGSGDFGILNANLQDGASVLCEPSDKSSRYLARYQIYQRNSNKKYFIGEWKYPVDSAEYSIFCYDGSGAFVDVIRVTERADKKRYTAVCELPESTDHAVLRVKRINGERVRAKPADKIMYLWLGLLFTSCAVSVMAALCLVYGYLTRILPETFSEGWGSIALSAAVVCAVSAAIYAAFVIWLVFANRDSFKPRAKKSKPSKKRRTFVKIGYIFTAACKIRNVFQGVLWASPLRKFVLHGRECEANARAIRRLKKDEGKRQYGR